MRFPRSSGILLHPTSLPSPHGIGDLGPEARRFVDFLADAGQKLWQVLPLGPTGYGESPYQCFSAWAGNPLLISLERLAAQGWLDTSALAETPKFPDNRVDFERLIPWKTQLLESAASRFLENPVSGFDAFCKANQHWLDDFALFMALKARHQGAEWTRWEADTRDRDPKSLARWQAQLAAPIAAQKFLQFAFFEQWHELREYARKHGVGIMGDLPIYVSHDSADVWVDRQYFQLDAHGNSTVVSGVPPDYFSETGQLWGNPIYRWDELAKDGYGWWLGRFRATFEMVDMIRLDHFRGFEAYWEVPASERTAVKGRWVKGPGADLFRVARAKLGDLPFVAENLGVITPEVEAIREEFGFPGMAVLQFAFGTDAQAPTFRPHNYPREVVAYTGTHDNDTTVGWWGATGSGESTRSDADIRKEMDFARRYLNTDGKEIQWTFIRTLEASVAATVLIQMQDLLGLGTEARMNQPATVGGNWRWRYRAGDLKPEFAPRLREMAELYDR
ncbi:MAG TPA: 4-alpha-glucanotransferase [Bryobacteraceae bacterium]|nr:4-alpha-glucanotransferase [Bryobacteraceae bacterium]